MKIDKNDGIIIICLLMYVANQLTKNKIPVPLISFFAKNYFNDVVCGCLVVAFSNHILKYYKNGEYRIKKLYFVLLFVLVCGIFWEFIIPFIRKNSTSDYVDIFAYLVGGILYWVFVSSSHPVNSFNCDS